MNSFLAITLLFALANAQTLNDGSWTSIANMTIARSDFGSSALNDFIVLTGGCLGPQIRTGSACDSYSCSSLTDYVEAYFPANNSYVRLPNLPRLRFRHSSEVINGLLYVIGGRDVNDTLITQIDIYNPANNSWSTSPYTLNGWCSDFSTFVKDSQIWMVGGYYQSYEVCSGVAYFDPKTGTNFTPLSSNMVDARGDTCSVYYNNSIYVIGGFDPNNNFTAPVDTIEVYNFNTGKWSYGPKLLNPGGDKACGILNNRLRTFGGEGKKFNGTCYYSDPESDTEEFFFTTQSWSQEPAMDTARFRFAAEYFQNNKIYIFGGQGQRDTVNDLYPTLNTAKVWTDSSATASTTASGSTASFFVSATVVMAALSFI